MIDIMNFFGSYAEEIGGQFTSYDKSKAVIVVPLTDGRYQTVLINGRSSNVSGKELIVMTSKICEFHGGIDLKDLLAKNHTFDYAKFILEDGYLKVQASTIVSSVQPEQVKEMIQEIALLADQYEFKFTGQDVH